MPEGHTIHALADRLERAFKGGPVRASSPQGRFAEGAALIDGSVLEGAEAWGKHLFVVLDGRTLHVHLGLIGSFAVRPFDGPTAPTPVGAVRLRLVGDDHHADLRGPMLCALVDAADQRRVTAGLGPDPLRRRQDPGLSLARIRKSRKGIAELLLDQSVVAGVGNVYRCEVLHRLRLDPLTPGRELTEEAWTAIWEDLVLLMPLGRVFSQIITMPDQVEAAARLRRSGRARAITASLTGERLGDHFERRFLVYQRGGQPCRRCAGTVRAEPVSGRNLYWCPTCQTGR